MFRVMAVLAAVLVAAAPAFAAGRGKEITFKSGDETATGYLAVPEGKGPFPAIVVIQDFYGLSEWIKENADRLAGQGYVALAPDLYRGKAAANPMEAMQLMRGMPRDRALRDLKGAAEALADRKDVDKERLGCIGWCMGGGYALQLALHDPHIKACAMCYGQVVTDAEKLKPLNAVVLGVFAEEDRGIPPAAVQKFEEALKEAGKKVYKIEEFKAGHGFMRPTSPDGKRSPAYNADEAKRAWQDVDRFFAASFHGEEGKEK
jgi:carboxymethylenebutenolidase